MRYIVMVRSGSGEPTGIVKIVKLRLPRLQIFEVLFPHYCT